ncbi:MAG: Gfo/Idh/MocA family oxidoreductase [Planctomycetota bacterium]
MPIHRPTRRRVLGGAAALSASIAAAPFVRTRPLCDRLKLAAVGAANRGSANIAGVLSHDVAALCDVDTNLLARGVGQVETAGQKRPKTYIDWRELLDEEKDLAGLVISTPDHTHAAIARAALRRGIPVYCEKPLTRTVAEARELLDLSRAAGVPTQMGTQIHARDNYRRVVEAIRSGAIGEVQAVHVVCAKSWSDGRYGEAKPVPRGLDWDLWLGPTAERPYCDGVHPAQWRRFWAFGTGTVGDMACHWVDLVHWALDLGTPNAIEVEGPEVHPDGTPKWMHVRWGHPAIEGRGAVEVHWWDGGMKPDFAPRENCHVFLGDAGRLVSTYDWMEVQLDEPGATWTPPEPTIESSPGHHVEWLRAIENSDPNAPLCRFEYSVPLTESVLLATVAYRAGGKITWDAETATPSSGAEFVSAEERDGWEV